MSRRKRRLRVARWDDDECIVIECPLGREGASAQYHPDGLIEIDTDFDERTILASLFHEFAHRLLDQTDLTFEEQEPLIDEVEPEFLAHAWAMGYRRIRQ